MIKYGKISTSVEPDIFDRFDAWTKVRRSPSYTPGYGVHPTLKGATPNDSAMLFTVGGCILLFDENQEPP